MTLVPICFSILVILLCGRFILAGIEEGDEAASSIYPSNPDETHSSNCSSLTVKLKFSTKVVEHGKLCYCSLHTRTPMPGS